MIVNLYLKPWGKSLLAYCNFQVTNNLNIPHFYVECFKQWFHFLDIIEFRKSPFNQIIWKNKLIRIDNKCIFWRNFMEVRIWVIGDLYKDGKIIEFDY